MTNITTETLNQDQQTEQTEHKVLKIIAKRTFCTVATTSDAGFAHSAGVIYAFADNALWVHTLRTGHKARNMASNGRVGVCIPFRRLPVGPPFTIHFQASAEALSRSAFSARFTELVDESPMGYVTKWRMFVAVELLRDQQLSIAQVASQTGYQSEASFSRAFKRVMGYPPSRARDAQRLAAVPADPMHHGAAVPIP